MIVSCAVDHTTADLQVRERFSFPPAQTGALLIRLKEKTPELEGCILLSTCNRTELYLCGGVPDPAKLLLNLAGLPNQYRTALVCRNQKDSIRHLMEVAAGLCSRVLGEDQILGQVKREIVTAREAKTMCPQLETLFRLAVTAGKKVKSTARLTPLNVSVASKAVEKLDEQLGGLAGKRALVIGSGEIGRLVAAALLRKRCEVTVTLRSHRHGTVSVPEGCASVLFQNRYDMMSRCDLVVSATASPHCTITADSLRGCESLPGLMLDLAVPRDIEPTVEERYGLPILNVDDLGGETGPDPVQMKKVQAILEDGIRRYGEWEQYRNLLPLLKDIKGIAVKHLSFTVVEDAKRVRDH